MDANTYTRRRDDMTAIFGDPIQVVTADDLVATGDLVDGTAAYAAGNGANPDRLPRLLFTPAAWSDLADWEDDNAAYQDVPGRIHDVVTASGFWHPLTGRCNTTMLGKRTIFALARIPNTAQANEPRVTNAAVTVHLDAQRPTLTFCLPHED